MDRQYSNIPMFPVPSGGTSNMMSTESAGMKEREYRAIGPMAIHFREIVCVSEPIRIYRVPLLPLRTQGDQTELYPMLGSPVCCYHKRIQTDVETSGYLLSLLVVMLVGVNPGDRDTANLQGNKEKN